MYYFYTNTYYDQSSYPESTEISNYIEKQETYLPVNPGRQAWTTLSI